MKINKSPMTLTQFSRVFRLIPYKIIRNKVNQCANIELNPIIVGNTTMNGKYSNTKIFVDTNE